MISHRHRFVFVHHPRTAGTSVEAVFGVGEPFANPEQPDDDRHRGLLEYRTLFPDEYERYFKFCFVRNPWERAVSYYVNLRRRAQEALDSFEQRAEKEAASVAARFVETETEAGKVWRVVNREQGRLRQRKLERLRAHPALQPFPVFLEQHDPREGWNQLLEDGADTSGAYDFVGRFEDLERGWAEVCRALALDAPLPHTNRTEHESYTTFYDDGARDRLTRLCAHDIELLGYRFGD